MRLLISGCSFTENGYWTVPLKENHTVVKNLAMGAAGNKYIANSVIDEELDSYDCAIVMWSGLNRVDALVEDISYYSGYPFKKIIKSGDAYILGGTRLGAWNHNRNKNHHLVRTLFAEQFKSMSDENIATLSLLEIIKLQNFLKVNNKKYKFCTYVNYWDQDKDWVGPVGDVGVNNMPRLEKLVKQIDFSNWVFTDKFDGIYEIAKENNLFGPDGYHPNIKAGMIWGQILNEKLNFKGDVDESNTME